MSELRLVSFKEFNSTQAVKFQSEHDNYRSIFTYSGLDPSSINSTTTDSKNKRDKKPVNESTVESNMKNQSNMVYSKLKQREDEEAGLYSLDKSAFDYKSIFSYSSPEKPKCNTANGSAEQPSTDFLAMHSFPRKLITNMALVFSYLFVFFTLPISIWFCFKNLPQWERIVIYRMGKLQGVKGPGNIFLIPWLDSCSKLDLRTQLICHPLKQFLTKDKAIIEASCSIYYRICDPVMYISNINDPGLRGLKLLANAITLKRFETSLEEDFHPSNKAAVENRILGELNVITTPWGIEISSVQIGDIRILQEAKPVNAFMDVMSQMGLSFGGDGSAPTSGPSATAVSLADIGIDLEGFSCGLTSKNAIRLQKVLNAATESVDSNAVICFKVGTDQPFYAQFVHGRGLVSERECSGEVTTTISLPQKLFDSLVNGASRSQFLQQYLEGQISIDGDAEALVQLQKLLPNLNKI